MMQMNKIASTDTTQKVKSFEIKVIPKLVLMLKQKYMNLESYSTYADISKNAARNFMVFIRIRQNFQNIIRNSAHTIKKDTLSKSEYWVLEETIISPAKFTRYNSDALKFVDGIQRIIYDSLKMSIFTIVYH